MAMGADRERMAWRELPAGVRATAAEILGSPIIEAVTQNGGFSAGSADRVLLADGRRAFIKTANASENADSARLHAREAEIVDALPPGLPVPACLGVAEHGGWVIAAYEDVAGSHPETPWRANDLRAVLDTFQRIAERPVSAALREKLPSARSALGDDILELGWSRVSDGLAREIVERESLRIPAIHGARHSEPQTDAATVTAPALGLASSLDDVGRLLADLGGDRLIHYDARADNILLRADGYAVIVDWPWACVGPAWVDPVGLLIDAAYFDADLDARAMTSHPAFGGVADETLARLLFQLAGHFFAKSEQPAPPGIPGLREFQRAEADVCLRLTRTLTR